MDVAWDELRVVLAVARAGGLSGAARALGVEHSTVYRRIQALEERLGARLFDRHRSGYVTTAHGELLVEAATRMDELANEGVRRVLGADTRVEGTVRLAVSELIAVGLLPRLLPLLRRDLPGLRVEVAVSNSAVDLTRREADVALRATLRPSDHLVGRQVAQVRYALFASPVLFPEATASAEQLAAAPWLGFDDRIAAFPNARWLAENPPESVPFLVFDSTVAMARAAAAGLGVAVLPVFAGAGEPGLVQIGDVLPITPMPVWALRHADLAQNARVRALMGFLAEQVAGALAEAEVGAAEVGA
jgi:DNA-binding transcriptional LysR family regulator